MKTETVLVWCDLCLKAGRAKVPAEHVEVKVGEAVLLEVDLCEKHRRSATRAVKKALPRFKVGRDRHRNARSRSEGPYRCQVRGCDVHPLKHRASLTQHLQHWHELALSEYVEEYGELVPMTPAEVKALVVTARCDETGCDQEYSTATGTRWPHQALVSHMRGRHALKLFPNGRKEPIA